MGLENEYTAPDWWAETGNPSDINQSARPSDRVDVTSV